MTGEFVRILWFILISWKVGKVPAFHRLIIKHPQAPRRRRSCFLRPDFHCRMESAKFVTSIFADSRLTVISRSRGGEVCRKWSIYSCKAEKHITFETIQALIKVKGKLECCPAKQCQWQIIFSHSSWRDARSSGAASESFLWQPWWTRRDSKGLP